MSGTGTGQQGGGTAFRQLSEGLLAILKTWSKENYPTEPQLRHYKQGDYHAQYSPRLEPKFRLGPSEVKLTFAIVLTEAKDKEMTMEIQRRACVYTLFSLYLRYYDGAWTTTHADFEASEGELSLNRRVPKLMLAIDTWKPAPGQK